MALSRIETEPSSIVPGPVVLVCLAWVLLFWTAPASADEASAVEQGAPRGYELALHGALTTELGHELRLYGVAYEVDGLSTLREGAGLQLEATLTHRDRQARRRAVVAQKTITVGQGGRFRLALSLPRQALAAPRLELKLHRRGQPGRRFTWNLQPNNPHRVDLLTDRRRYEPGESIRVWVRLTAVQGAMPVVGGAVHLTLLDQAGRPAGDRTATSSAAGVASFELELPESAADGYWTVRAEVVDGGLATPAEQQVQVTRRTVERLQASIELEQELVRPGGGLTGTVVVRTPSGSAVRGAQVELVQGSGEPLVLVTDAEGVAAFQTSAPAFLSGDVARQSLEARVVHPAHGTIRVATSYLVSRVNWMVAATPSAGALVPELPSEIFVSVTDPLGQPAPAGTKVRVRGRAVQGEVREVSTDARGLARVAMELPRGAASQRDSGRCQGGVATTVEVEVLTRRPVMARLCVPVALDALVLPRVGELVVPPGAEVPVEVARRPEVLRRPVVIEALWAGRAVAWAWLDGRQRTVSVRLPPAIQGVIELRARPVWPSNRRRPWDQPGATALGVGASAAVLVRPADAFDLQVEPERELWRIRDEARVSLQASQPPPQGWAALLVRDEAAHGGEGPWDLEWIRQELREATSGRSDESDLILRAALAALIEPDVEQAEPPPLYRPPWDQSGHTGSYRSSSASAAGVLRDPLARREELLRRGLWPAMRALERAVGRLGSAATARRGIVRQQGRRSVFAPDAVANVVRARQLRSNQAHTLGGEPLTVAMIRAVDPSFSFDNVARRVARQRLVRLLHALFRLADPDNPHAIRASSGEPPARWLSRLVQLGMVEDAALIDPWGRPFVFRRLPPGRRAVVVVSERAVDFELVSPGPDGISGNGDDVRDPFQRVVPRHTPYAVASGEDALMQRLSRIAPGNNVLQSMVQAYRRQSLAVLEESRRGPVEATGSEDMDDMGPGDLAESDAIMAEEEQAGEALGGMSLEGRGYGAGGGRAGPRRSRSRRAEATASLSPDEPAPAPPPAPTKSLRPQSPLAAPAATIPRAMGELVRERFPATLFFLAETPLNAQGQTLVDVPLADALTTYRLEAIAWTASGWTTSAMGRLRVDQEAMVDAPVPAVATRGDNLRLPVRVANRTANALATRIEVEVEGDLSLSVPEPFRLVVPPGEAREHIVEVQPGTVGQGTLLVRLVRDEDGRSLDAVRRPLTVQENVRLARESREELIVAGQTLRVHVPDEATPRGPGELRLALGSGLFGDPARWALDRGREGTLWGGWALSVSNRPLPEEMTTALLTNLSHDEDEWYGEPVELALVVANLWTNQQLSDDMVRLGLRAMSELLVAEGEESVEAGDDEALWLLLALAPVVRQAERRPALRGDVADLVGGLGRMISSQAAQAAEAPAQWARAAAALALGRGGEVDARAREMVRRASRHVIEVGDEAWLEPSTTDGTVLPRLEPTSLLALARLALGDSPAEVLPLLRSLARVLRGVEEWPVRSRALASAAAAALTGSAAPPDRLTILLDGQRLDVERDEGVLRAVLPGIGRPGEHEIDLRLGSGQVALAWLDVRYGLPWHVRPRRQAAVDLQWTGQAGVRDGRAGLRLEIRNRGARILTRPVVEVELPAGSELDEGTRQSLESLLAEPATMEGRTLRLRLRPLAPGGYLRLPLPLRWAVGGTIMGLGTTLWDDAGPSSLAERPAQILPSRGVEIADRGSEPPLQEAESSPPFFGPEPRPPLLLAPLAPIAEVLQ